MPTHLLLFQTYLIMFYLNEYLVHVFNLNVLMLYLNYSVVLRRQIPIDITQLIVTLIVNFRLLANY